MHHVLAIGAHPDDIEIGCGATLAKHAALGDEVTMLVITDGAKGPGKVSDRVREQEAACAVLGIKTLLWGNIPDCEVSLHEAALVKVIERAIVSSAADVIYTHSHGDSHQDHRAVAFGTLGAARHCPTVLCFDSPSSLAFQPTVFVNIADHLPTKVAALRCHASQVIASPMVSADRELAKATVAGHAGRVATAEAFMPVRMLMSP